MKSKHFVARAQVADLPLPPFASPLSPLFFFPWKLRTACVAAPKSVGVKLLPLLQPVPSTPHGRV